MTCDYIPPTQQLNECDWNCFGVYSYSQRIGCFVSLATTVFWAEPFLFRQTGFMKPHHNRVPSLILLPFFPFSADTIPAPHISSHRHCSRVCSWIVRTLWKRKNVTLPRKDSFSLIFLPNCTEDASVMLAEVSAVSLIQRRGLLMEVEVSKNTRSLLVSV